MPSPPPVPPDPPPVPSGPYAPSAGQLARFWLAGPLTLLVFAPLGAGIVGAPLMPVGMLLAFFALRGGRDRYSDAAVAGFQIGIAVAAAATAAGVLLAAEVLFLFWLAPLFGPAMAMIFRLIAGSWRPAAERNTPAPRPAVSS